MLIIFYDYVSKTRVVTKLIKCEWFASNLLKLFFSFSALIALQFTHWDALSLSATAGQIKPCSRGTAKGNEPVVSLRSATAIEVNVASYLLTLLFLPFEGNLRHHVLIFSLSYIIFLCNFESIFLLLLGHSVPKSKK